MTDVGQWISQSRRLIDEWIGTDAKAMGREAGSVEEAMRYSLEAGGKRLRPQLVLASAEYVGLAWDSVRDAALAVEFLHTYSLIHDDLPAMDNDDLRRGVPTSHKVFGEAMAILAGDALLTEAFFKITHSAGFSPGGVLAASQQLALAAGRRGLVRGQVMDLAAEHQDIGVEQLEQIHRHKTGALFEACVMIPPLLSGDSQAASVMSSFGRHFGLAFQMVDDILNVVGDAEQLGKATGTDAGLGKATYPRLIGMDAAHGLVQEHARLAKSVLDPLRSHILRGLLDFAVERTW